MQLKITLAYFLAIATCSVSLNALEWTPGTPLPEMQAIVRTTAQIMEQVPPEKRVIHLPKANLQSPVKDDLRVKKAATNSSSPIDPKQLSPNFLVARYEDSGVVPPDAMGVVGPTQFILAANGLVRSFDKSTGKVDHVLNISTTLFFSAVAEGSFTSDSRIRYDRFSDRWFIAINATAPLRTLIAMSDSGTITAGSNWSFFYIQPRQDAMADYPTLGIDKHALYIGVNIIGKNGYVNSDAFVIPKPSLIKGTIKAFAFPNLVTKKNNEGPMTPQGVDNYDLDAMEGYFIGNNGSGRDLVMRRIKDPDGHPAISNDINIAIPKTASPLKVPQKGSLSSALFFLQGFDKRLSSPHIRDKQLYVAHNVGVNNTGSFDPSTPTRDGCLWYEINLNDPSNPSFLQTGVLYQPSPSNDLEERYYWMPGVMTNGLHTLAMACSTAGDKEFPNAAFALRFSDEPKGTMRKPLLYTASTVIYKLGYPPFKSLRWGEYSHVSVDPTDNMTFWCIAEFSLAYNSWGLQAVRIPAPPPAQVVRITPSAINEDQKEVKLSVIGKRVEGSAFYDP